MSIDKKTVQYVAHLARIELEDKEVEKLSLQLKDILDFIDTLGRVDTAEIKPTSHILPIQNVLREDIPRESLPLEKTLKNAPSKEGNFFTVPKVIE